MKSIAHRAWHIELIPINPPQPSFRKGGRGWIWGFRGICGLTLCALLFALCQPLWADSNPDNDFANIEITIRPSVDRGVIITTDTPGMLDLGNVEMGVSTQTVFPATVTVVGTVTNIELDLSAQIEGGWLFDNNVENSEENNLQAWTLFTATDSATPPSETQFITTKSTLTPSSASAYFGPVRVGFASGDTGANDRFEDSITNMDSMLPGAQRHWWFYFKTPPTTTTVDEQKITFILSVTGGP